MVNRRPRKRRFLSKPATIHRYKKRHIRKELGVNCTYVSELPSTPGLGKRRIVSEKNVFETSSYINLRLFDVNIPQKKSSNRNGTLCLFPEELVDSEV